MAAGRLQTEEWQNRFWEQCFGAAAFVCAWCKLPQAESRLGFLVDDLPNECALLFGLTPQVSGVGDNDRKSYFTPGICAGDFAGRGAMRAGVAVTHDANRKRGQIRHRFESVGRKPIFHLYISGATPRSTAAITHLKPVLEKLFEGHYELRVTDIYQEPKKANAAKVYLAPTLVRESPAPVLRIVGDFSSEEVITSLLIARLSNEVPDE